MTDLTSSALVYGLPRSHWHCTLANFDWSSHEGKRDDLDRLLEELASSFHGTPAPHLYMTGPPGLGKSHLAVGLYRWAVYRTDVSRCCYLDVPAFCEGVKSSFGTDTDPFFDVDRAGDLLVMDDIFGRDLSEYETNNILARVVDTAHRNNAALVVTTNYTTDELSDKLLPHEISRIFQRAAVWEFVGEDRRL